MSEAAISGIMVGRCQLIMAAKGCYKCGVEFSDGWAEKHLWIVIEGRRHQIAVPVCAGCAPFSTPAVPPKGRSA